MDLKPGDPVMVESVSSAVMYKAKVLGLVVLYGVECERNNAPAKAFVEAELLGKQAQVTYYAGKWNVHYVKVTLSGGSDLSETLLRRGLVKWDRATWPDLKSFEALEKEGNDAKVKAAAEEQAQKDSVRAKQEEEIAAREAKLAAERQQRENERAIADWKGLSPEERKATRAALVETWKRVNEKQAKADALYDLIVAGQRVLQQDSLDMKVAEKTYDSLKQHYGPNFEIEFGLQRHYRSVAEANAVMQQWRERYKQLAAELQSEWPSYEQERARIAFLDDALPKDVLDEEGGGMPEMNTAGEYAASGTGFIVAPDTLLTCAHLVEKASEITVCARPDRKLAAQVIAKDKENDWALLRVPGLGGTPIPMAAGDPNIGATVYCLGFPVGSEAVFREPVAGMGNIAALYGLNGDTRHVQITIPINEGNSGSPVLDKYGQWVGLVSHKLSDISLLKETGTVAQGLNYAIKAPLIGAAAVLKAKTEFAKAEPNPKECDFEALVKKVSGAVFYVLVK